MYGMINLNFCHICLSLTAVIPQKGYISNLCDGVYLLIIKNFCGFYTLCPLYLLLLKNIICDWHLCHWPTSVCRLYSAYRSIVPCAAGPCAMFPVIMNIALFSWYRDKGSFNILKDYLFFNYKTVNIFCKLQLSGEPF